jgi:hypothetical protein
MDNLNNKRNWWLIPVVAGILSFGVILIQRTWLPNYELPAFLFVAVLLGIAFYWVYRIDQQGFWWAQIPAMVMMTLLVTAIVAYFTPKDASGSSPYGVLTLGLGAAVMGFVLKHTTAKIVMFSIAVITLLVGILMLPLGLIWKVILIILDVLLIGFVIWQTYRQLPNK